MSRVVPHVFDHQHVVPEMCDHQHVVPHIFDHGCVVPQVPQIFRRMAGLQRIDLERNTMSTIPQVPLYPSPSRDVRTKSWTSPPLAVRLTVCGLLYTDGVELCLTSMPTIPQVSIVTPSTGGSRLLRNVPLLSTGMIHLCGYFLAHERH